MSPAWGQIAGVATVILMVAFVAIWAWAWLPRHKRTFDDLAKLPLEDRALARPGEDVFPPKRTAFASPQGASALGRPGGAVHSRTIAGGER